MNAKLLAVLREIVNDFERYGEVIQHDGEENYGPDTAIGKAIELLGEYNREPELDFTFSPEFMGGFVPVLTLRLSVSEVLDFLALSHAEVTFKYGTEEAERLGRNTIYIHSTASMKGHKFER